MTRSVEVEGAHDGVYRAYLGDLLTTKFVDHGPTAMSRLLASGLVMVDHRLGEDERCRILTAAEDEMGATAATFVHVCVTTRAWHAVALYKDQDKKVVQKQAPLYFRENKLLCKDKELVLAPGPLPFRVCAWIARTVFGLHDKNAFPLLHGITHESLCFRPSTSACYESAITPVQMLRTMDLYVHDVAKYTRDFDPMEASIVDILHFFGVVYVGSVNEATSSAERKYIQHALTEGKEEGLTHLWWIEDRTLYGENRYNLVIRYTLAGKPYYMKRPLLLSKNRETLRDVVTQTQSNAMNFDYGECGIVQFTEWVQTFLGLPAAKAWPYMRHEIMDRYKGLVCMPMVRPCLTNGKVSDVLHPSSSELAPRLLYSPDLFVEPRKIPKDTNPSTVHFRIVVKPCTSLDMDEMDLRMFLRVGDDAKNAYRVLFTKDRQIFPEEDQLRVFVQSENEDSLGKDAIQLVVLRRRLSPCGAVVVEFVFTSYWKPFRLYVDSKTCDYEAQFTLSDYLGQTRVFPMIALPVFTRQVHFLQTMHHAMSANEAAESIVRQDKIKALVPLLYVETSPQEGEGYEFQYYDGEALVSAK